MPPPLQNDPWVISLPRGMARVIIIRREMAPDRREMTSSLKEMTPVEKSPNFPPVTLLLLLMLILFLLLPLLLLLVLPSPRGLA